MIPDSLLRLFSVLISSLIGRLDGFTVLVIFVFYLFHSQLLNCFHWLILSTISTDPLIILFRFSSSSFPSILDSTFSILSSLIHFINVF